MSANKQMYSFYDTNGEKLIPSWFKLDVEKICDELLGGVGDFGDEESFKEVIDMYKEEGLNFFQQLGIFVANLMIHHCNRDIPDSQIIKMSKDFKKLYRYHLTKIDEAYDSWETKKNNLKGKDN